MSSQQYLFLFTIGPVQSFIEQARKTRDLFAGSQILSELIEEAIKEVLYQHSTNTLVFPFNRSSSEIQSSNPNRFLVKVDTDDIQKFGKSIETACRKRWIQLATEAFWSAELPHDLPIIDEALVPLLSELSCMEIISKLSSIAAHQIAEFPDIYWASIEYSESGDYALMLQKLEQLLGGVKNVRKFCQLKEPEGSRKCSLDGERTALFYREAVDVKGKYVKPNFLSRESKSVKNLLDPGEALSAVSLVKRFYRKNDSKFPSTAEIALMHLIDDRWKSMYRKYFDGEVDYQLFYEENLTEKNLEKQGIRKKTGDGLDVVIRAMRDLTKEKRTKYYALLLFDGDDFGKLWSGQKLRDGVNLENFQKELVERLHDYAQTGRKCLDESRGKTVYTGGDDFLGFVNLTCLFAVIEELRTKFHNEVYLPLSEYLDEGHFITFSAGVVIAHYKAPLGEVLKKARAIERAAKNVPGKNAYGIAVMKHSGEMHEGCIRFSPGYVPQGYSGAAASVSMLGSIVTALKDDPGFSNTFIKSFGREFHGLIDQDGHGWRNDAAIHTELFRLLARSSKSHGEAKKKAVRGFLEVVDSLRLASKSISNFQSLLDISDFIKRETSETKL
jgi:CRISPR-associated protein Cmr2